MSRAFMKEAEERDPRCPEPTGCGGRGVPAPRATIAALAKDPGAVAAFSGEPSACDDPECEVAYFDAFGGRILVSELKSVPWPKDASAPVCPCFGVVAADIENWARDGKVDALKDLVKRAAGRDAVCATKTFDGGSCVAHVRRLWIRNQKGGG